MTKEELLKPRIKVMADWPRNNIMKVGEIWFFIEGPTGFQDGYYSDNIKGFPTGKVIVPGDIDPHPHLFKKLEWHEDREEKDLPEYVKGVDWPYKGRIYKILDPSHNGREFHRDYEIEHRTFHHWPNSFLPAAKEEYNAYIKKLEKP